MTRAEFFQVLLEKGYDREIISFDDPLKDGYGIRKVYFRWEIFFRERGVESNVRGFPSESDALLHLLDDIENHRT